MNTNVGQNFQGILYMIMGSVTLMEPGLDKTILLGAGMLVLGFVAFATKGSGLSSEDGHRLKERLADDDIDAILDEGRREIN